MPNPVEIKIADRAHGFIIVAVCYEYTDRRYYDVRDSDGRVRTFNTVIEASAFIEGYVYAVRSRTGAVAIKRG